MSLDLKAARQEQYLIPIKIIMVYVAWKVFHHFASVSGTALNSAWIHFTFSLGSIYASITSILLSAGGMKAYSEGIDINLVASYKRVLVQDHCLAIPVMVIFSGAVMFFRGRWQDKALFLIVGLVGIVIINIVRLILVAISWAYMSPYYFVFNHSYSYLVATYGFIFCMIMWWMNHVMKKDDNVGAGQIA